MAELNFCELELSLRWLQADCYEASMRFTQPRDDADIRLSDPVPIQINKQLLLESRASAAAYGAALASMLFGPAQLREVYEKARAVAESSEFGLRLRLFIGNNATELHDIWWETILDPVSKGHLLMREDIAFSRYLDSADWRPITPVRKRSLGALVVIANPTDIDQYEVDGRALLSVSVAAELEAVSAGLGDIQVTQLVGAGQATLDNIVANLRKGFDILYLVCHGALVNKESHLYLEDAAGLTAVAHGQELSDRLREMKERPRLVVLASCQSAGTGGEGRSEDGGALSALAPRLTENGIPAVLAMQGNVSVATVSKFMPEFFAQLERHGQIDRAMAVARSSVRNRPDWWMPVLFMRLKSGVLWYERGFIPEGEQRYANWEGLLQDLELTRTVMVLGPSLYEHVLGTNRDIARRWAENYAFPMAPQEREDLPQVAQYLAYSRNHDFPLEQLRVHLKEEIVRRHGKLLPEEMREINNPANTLDRMVLEVGRQLRTPSGDGIENNDVHSRLASLPIATFVTTNRDNLLEDALRQARKEPEVVICRWRDLDESQEMEWPKSVFDREPTFVPSVERPLVFHVFGNLRYPISVVLTEDDYFEFLVGVTRNQANLNTGIPPAVRHALAANGLVFLGFHVDDWDFRVLFRGILRKQGAAASRRRANVAVQIEPSEGRMLEPRRAKEYLEKYFQSNREIGTYWGTYEDFIQELVDRWRRRRGPS